MVAHTVELKFFTKDGEICNGIRIRHSICPADVRGHF